jgi:hypothetical protein
MQTSVLSAGIAGLIVAVVSCSSRGGEGEECNSASLLGPSFCDPGLVCNEARAPWTCEKPNIHGEGEPCSGNANCRPALWCNLNERCVAALTQGAACSLPVACATNLTCFKNTSAGTATCEQTCETSADCSGTSRTCCVAAGQNGNVCQQADAGACR